MLLVKRAPKSNMICERMLLVTMTLKIKSDDVRAFTWPCVH